LACREGAAALFRTARKIERFARGDLALRRGGDDRGDRRREVRGIADRREIERDRAAAPGRNDPVEAEQQREAVAVERTVDGAAGRDERITAAEPRDLPGARVANAARPAGGIAGTALRETSVPITTRCLLLQKEIRVKYLIFRHSALRLRRH
jgi:hypothetical protein